MKKKNTKYQNLFSSESQEKKKGISWKSTFPKCIEMTWNKIGYINFQFQQFSSVVTNDWISAIEKRGLPLNNAGILPNTEDFRSLGRIWNIYVARQ